MARITPGRRAAEKQTLGRLSSVIQFGPLHCLPVSRDEPTHWPAVPVVRLYPRKIRDCQHPARSLFGEIRIHTGVDATFDVWMRMPHGFINGVGNLNAATQTISAIGTFLKGRLVGAR
jgi:hypothetical protein